jgi:signal transduction histidine kinase
MNDQSTTQELRGRVSALETELEGKRSELKLLAAELEATNKGVLALYAEIDDKAEQLRYASELKSRFLSYLSHEFRTPLGAIRSVVRLLMDRLDGPLTAEQEKQLRFIQGSAVELTDLVEDLLDLAKIEAGRITVSPEWFEMVDLFAALRGMFRPLLIQGGPALVFEEPVGVTRVFTDDKKLSQILRNFISNALKFTEHGEVRVSAHQAPPERVRFAVRDTGIGIQQEQLAHLFEDFVQLRASAQRRWNGAGLGLSISKKLAAVLGGEVAAESKVGVGSTFSVTIPLQYSGAAGAPGASQPGPRGKQDE